jgi:hypothetical protein
MAGKSWQARLGDGRLSHWSRNSDPSRMSIWERSAYRCKREKEERRKKWDRMAVGRTGHGCWANRSVRSSEQGPPGRDRVRAIDAAASARLAAPAGVAARIGRSPWCGSRQEGPAALPGRVTGPRAALAPGPRGPAGRRPGTTRPTKTAGQVGWCKPGWKRPTGPTHLLALRGLRPLCRQHGVQARCQPEVAG